MDNLKTLIGSSTHIPEMDDEEQENSIEEASVNFDVHEIIDNIGKPEFKTIYFILSTTMKLLPTDTQKGIALGILKKIYEVYDYEFLPYPNIDGQEDINNVYELLEFLEYDHIEFFSRVWMFLDDIQTVDLKKYCVENIDKILYEIEEQILSTDLNELISIFLRTNNKENMISLVTSISEKNRMLIKLEILERKENGK